MFMLVYEWINETDGSLYDQEIAWFDTKEELLKAYKVAKQTHHYQINIGRLFLSAAVNYSWAEIEELFQSSFQEVNLG